MKCFCRNVLSIIKTKRFWVLELPSICFVCSQDSLDFTDYDEMSISDSEDSDEDSDEDSEEDD